MLDRHSLLSFCYKPGHHYGLPGSVESQIIFFLAIFTIHNYIPSLATAFDNL
jgi:hypothetical protein